MPDYTDHFPYALRKTLPLNNKLLRSANLTDRLDEEDLKELGHMVVEDFERDRSSRQEWETRMDDAMRLALQVCEKKTFPWEGAANVKFPLITIAAMQYSSRAYPALVNGPRPIACEPIMPRPDITIPAQLIAAAQQQGPQAQQAQQQIQQITQFAQAAMQAYHELESRANRISYHMSYQILEEDPDWEENHDKALLIQCLLGCVFKKVYFDPVRGHHTSECVSPRDLVVSYYSKGLETAPRITHVIYLSHNDCYERQARGIFAEFEEGAPQPEPRLSYEFSVEANDRQGLTQQPSDHDAPYEMLEQHRNLDLDGDGYAEPYAITVRYDTRQVMRLVPRFTRADITFAANGKVICISPIECFTKYPFIPSPDGGFYDLGFGALLGPLNETIDSAINQLLDSATLATAGGGFLGRGFRNKKGEYRFRPGEWKSVDCPGDDLRKNVLPLPTGQPSPVMFQLLTLLIEYAEGIAGAVDILQGKNPGQNTPAETSRAMVEQGMKIFNGIYKRTHRGFTREVRLLYRLNTIYFTEQMPYYVTSRGKNIFRDMAKDYKDARLMVKAAADPFYMSDAQRYNQATSLLAAAHSSPGYDLYQVNRYYLEALKLPAIDRFLPDPKGPFAVPPPPNPKIIVEQIKAQTAQMKQQLDFKVKLLDLVQKAELQTAQIEELKAKAAFELAEAQGVGTGHAIALIEAQIGAAKAKQEGLLEAIKLLHEVTQPKEEPDGQGSSNAGSVGSMAPGPGNPGIPAGLAAQAAGVPGGMGQGALPK